MPSSFANQFALSLEVTRLVPISTIAEAAAKAVFKLARDLRNSGSDMVLEQDLAEVFGRCRITHEIERSFRTVVAKSIGTTPLSEQILLQKGPGPTATRALSPNQSAYLSCLVQCSFLSWVHDKQALARAIAQALEKRVQGASPEADSKAPPTHDGVLGYLTACEEQTNAFEWDHYLVAFASMCGISHTLARESIPAVILRGALDMFPMVQHFPENYLIHISTDSGECILLVWAHSILGLTVLILGEGHRPDLKLGQGDPQVVVDISVANTYLYPASITLLDSSKEPHEELITISPDPDESIIDGTWKIPAKGYGKSMLESVCDKYGYDLLNGNSEAARAIVDEMALVASANAQTIAKSLVRNKPVGMVTTPAQPAFAMKYVTERRQILRAAKFLFDRPELEDEEISVYHTSTPLHQNTPLPSSVAGALQVARRNTQEWNANFWKPMVKAVQALSLLLLAFAHVRDLDECGALPLCGSYTLLQQHGLITPFAPTSGSDLRAEINVEDASWFNVIVLLLVGHIIDVNHHATCLISDRGWSIYMNTFRTPDPAFIDPGFFRIQPGVPVRNGVRKHAILDGPATGLDSSRWDISNTSGQDISLCCFDNVEFGNSEHGERRDAFVLNLRLVMLEHPNANALLTRRTGLRELNAALWISETTRFCDHVVDVEEEVTLPSGCAALCGFGDLGYMDVSTPLPNERVLICLTANNIAARWRALIAVKNERKDKKHMEHVLLRTSDCCLRCAIAQSATRRGKCFLIL